MVDILRPQLRNLTTVSPRHNLVASTGLASVPSQGASADGRTPYEIGPAAVVDLSDQAKVAIQQNRIAQGVADSLAKQIAAMKGKIPSNTIYNNKKDESTINNNDTDIIKTISVSNFNRQAEQTKQTEQTKWRAGAPYGNPTTSDSEFLKNNLLDQEGFAPQEWSPEEVRAFKDAIRNGTVKIQHAADIEGLNFTSWQVFTPNANNGAGYDSMGGTSQDPTGDVKKAIDSHRAMAMWTADRGDVYLSW